MMFFFIRLPRKYYTLFLCGEKGKSDAVSGAKRKPETVECYNQTKSCILLILKPNKHTYNILHYTAIVK